MSSQQTSLLFRVPTPGVSRRSARLFAKRLSSEIAAGRAFGCLITGDAELRRLNREFRRQDHATDVLSFAAEDEGLAPRAPFLMGDVVLAFETVSRQAQEQGKPLADHLRHLVVHGVLHLLGYDHQEPGAAQEMEALETRVLARLGIADPYAERQAAGDD